MCEYVAREESGEQQGGEREEILTALADRRDALPLVHTLLSLEEGAEATGAEVATMQVEPSSIQEDSPPSQLLSCADLSAARRAADLLHDLSDPTDLELEAMADLLEVARLKAQVDALVMPEAVVVDAIDAKKRSGKSRAKAAPAKGEKNRGGYRLPWRGARATKQMEAANASAKSASRSASRPMGKKSSMRDAAPVPAGSEPGQCSVDRAAASPDRIALQGGTAHSPPTLEKVVSTAVLTRGGRPPRGPQQQHDPLRIRPYILHEYYSYVDSRVSVSSHLASV